MEISKIFIWATKIAFLGATALLAIGVYAARSPWWLIGLGLLLLVSFRALALCRIPLSTVFPLFLCNIYFIVAFFKIVLDNNASAWWLIVALLLEVIIVGNAQNQVEEDEKKSKLAEETEKRFAEAREKAAQTLKDEYAKDDNDDDDENDDVRVNSTEHTRLSSEELLLIRNTFKVLTNWQLYHIVINSGSSKDDITIATDLLTKRKASELLNQINKQ